MCASVDCSCCSALSLFLLRWRAASRSCRLCPEEQRWSCMSRLCRTVPQTDRLIAQSQRSWVAASSAVCYSPAALDTPLCLSPWAWAILPPRLRVSHISCCLHTRALFTRPVSLHCVPESSIRATTRSALRSPQVRFSLVMFDHMSNVSSSDKVFWSESGDTSAQIKTLNLWSINTCVFIFQIFWSHSYSPVRVFPEHQC